MSAQVDSGPAPGRLSDYRAHYQADAEAIVDPGALHPVRQASEQRRIEALVRLLGLNGGERLLDAGCGSGWLADQCQRRGARVCALDLAPAGVAAARQRFPGVGAYQVGDLYHLPFASSSFDVVVLSEVVEHLEEVGAVLGEVGRVLRPGGRILVSVPYRETIVQHLCIHCNRLTPANAHLHSFDEARLASHFHSAGLQVRRSQLLTNKVLELAGFPRWSARWPHALWRAADRLGNWLVGRPAFLLMLGQRPV